MVIAPARRAGDPVSNAGPGENFSLKLFIYIYLFICKIQLIPHEYKRLIEKFNSKNEERDVPETVFAQLYLWTAVLRYE